MADELSVSASMTYEYADTSIPFELPAALEFDVSVQLHQLGVQNIATSESALDLGSVTTLGYILIVNRSTQYYVELRTGTGGTKFATLDANNGFAFFKFGSGVTAPYAIATGGTCRVEYFLVNA